MKGIISIILLSITTLSIAQTNLISGSVNDQQNAPVEFANVLLLLSKDSALVKGNITDEKGFFSFENIPSNEYIVSINQIGMEKYYSEKFLINEDHSVKDLGEIVIKNETSTLKEVVITSVKFCTSVTNIIVHIAINEERRIIQSDRARNKCS